jgi:hypothetical protein
MTGFITVNLKFITVNIARTVKLFPALPRGSHVEPRGGHVEPRSSHASHARRHGR